MKKLYITPRNEQEREALMKMGATSSCRSQTTSSALIREKFKDEVLKIMQQVLDESPCGFDFAEDGRYVWPDRWDDLKRRIEGMKSSNDSHQVEGNNKETTDEK